MRRLLLVADLTGLIAALPTRLTLSARTLPDEEWHALFVVSLPLWIVLLCTHGLYDRDEERSDQSTVDDIFGVFQMLSLGTWGFIAVTVLTGFPHPTLPRLVVFWLMAILLVPLFRAIMRLVGRRWRIDELPQLINVEISLVGPRPLVLDEDQHVQQWARRRLELKPGMTGLW
jgi:hypothetical protein